MTETALSHAGRTDVLLAWLKRCNQAMLTWAASLTWLRLIVLGLIVLIASSWIGETLNLRPDVQRSSSSQADDADTGNVGNAEQECNDVRIRIGGKDFIQICDRAKPIAAASSAQTSGSGENQATEPAPPVIEPLPAPRTVKAKRAKNEARQQVTRTLGGMLGDLISAALIAFFAYLIAAKVIVRKSAESAAKLRAANVNAQHEATQRQLLQARLKLLQAQVEPHFLFNTLAAVDYLIETDPPKASVMQKKLITYLRAALPQMRQESSTLGREVELSRAYLELLKMRIEDRLEIDIAVPPELESAVFPPMVLQTLVENAIKHGIEPKPEGGKVSIHAQARDGNLWVDVIDTGVGLPDGDIVGVSSNGTGLGLDNIRKRLALLYPGASRMELRREFLGGTSARLVIPYQTEHRDAPDSSHR